MVNKLKDTTPRPRIGKTAKDTRMARLIDINKIVTEFNTELTQEVLGLQNQIDLLTLGGGSGTTTIVNISSAQILAMGASPIELLPAPGVGKYYDYYGILEMTHVTTVYSPPQDDSAIICDGITYGGTCLTQIGTVPSNQIFYFSNKSTVYPEIATNQTNSNLVNTVMPFSINGNIVMTTFGGGEYMLGDGTARAIITYTVRTFGA